MIRLRRSLGLGLGIFTSLFVLGLAQLSGCVSVKIGSGETEKAKNVRFTQPARPFVEWESPVADRGWQSERTGNTISYLSECRANQSLPDLNVLEREAVAPLDAVKELRREQILFDGRAAILAEHAGTVDGVPVQLQTLVLSKNGCAYTLTYGGEKSVYPQEVAVFEAFRSSFRAP